RRFGGGERRPGPHGGGREGGRPGAVAPRDRVAVAGDGQVVIGGDARQPRGAVGGVVHRGQREGRAGRQRDRIRPAGRVGGVDVGDQVRDAAGSVGRGQRPVFQLFQPQLRPAAWACPRPGGERSEEQVAKGSEPHGWSPFGRQYAVR